MKNRIFLILLTIIIPTLSIVQLMAAWQPDSLVSADPSMKFSAEFEALLKDALPDEKLRFIIHFQDDADLSLKQSLSIDQRRQFVVQQLQETAAASQAPILQQLEILHQQQQVTQFRTLWIINGLSVTGTPAAAHQLADDPQVALIDIDRQWQGFAQVDDDFEIESLKIPSAPITDTIKSWGIAHIRAPHVWHGLGVTGEGITVGIIDTGVDYQHPDLLPNYRGNMGNGTFDHTGNWFDAYDSTHLVPTDTLGHGTHVAGTAVGQNGIGVAPGAQWIAVNIATPQGAIYDSDAHAGLQWLLAPGGDPSKAPDIVNGSWGGQFNNPVWIEDIAALRAAGIIPIFAMGNSGPRVGSISAPASYTDTFAVGAHDEFGQLAWFSGQGPSQFHSQIRPQVLGPGTSIFSAFPNGLYAISTGTSMATPHATGAAALLLAANSGLDFDTVAQTLQSTAVPVSSTVPTMGSGWGAVDALAAVAQYQPHGILSGQIKGDGGPLPNIPISITTSSSRTILFYTDENGRYEAPLSPGSYTIAVEQFGFETYEAANISISENQTKIKNINLILLPNSTISGQLVDSSTNLPLEQVVVSINGLPAIQAATDENGRYQLTLPEGQFKLLYEKSGYQIGRKTIFSQPNQPQTIDVSLTPAPTVLLIDSGSWYFASQADFYANSLRDLDVSFDLHAIRHPFKDLPTDENLAEYDNIIWSDPYASPGQLGLGQTISNYLTTGGNLMISGQNIGLYDGAGFFDFWWHNTLQAQYLGKEVITQAIQGAAETPYAGLAVHLNGGSSANNQGLVDAAEPLPGSLGQPIFHYPNGQPAGIGLGQCEPYRLVYLGFGLEGATFSVVRTAVLRDTFEFFEQKDEQVGLRWLNKDVDDFALPGEHYSYTLTVQNLSELYTDTVKIETAEAFWPVSVMTPTLTLGPCQSAQTIVSLRVPDHEPDDSYHYLEVSAVSSLNPNESKSLDFNHKTPGDILLVDDDRWYDQEVKYQAALDAMNLTYDTLDTNWKTGIDKSPSADFLAAYDFVIWYTGYDWFQPITAAEREALESYLSNGGRIFLSSQDFLFHHQFTDLANSLFGVETYRESVASNAIFGLENKGYRADLFGPLTLTLGAYQNFSDSIIPQPDAEVLLRQERGWPVAIGNEGEHHRSVFMAFPYETMPAPIQNEMMNQMVGWIGDLGGSNIVVDDEIGAANQPRTYTITIKNTAVSGVNQINVKNSLPPEITLQPATLSDGAVYDSANHRIEWHGELQPGASHQIVYQAIPQGSPGEKIENQVTFSYDRHPIAFHSYATIWIDPPDLSQSTLFLTSNQPIVPDHITLTMWLTNSGMIASDGITAVVYLPPNLYPLTDTLTTPMGTASFNPIQLAWAGDLSPGESVSASLTFTRNVWAITEHFETLFYFHDGISGGQVHPFETYIQPYRWLFPFVGTSNE